MGDSCCRRDVFLTGAASYAPAWPRHRGPAEFSLRALRGHSDIRDGAHILGGLAMLVGLVSAGFYLYLRQQIAHDEAPEEPPQR